jgi:hypothetical protein
MASDLVFEDLWVFEKFKEIENLGIVSEFLDSVNEQVAVVSTSFSWNCCINWMQLT